MKSFSSLGTLAVTQSFVHPAKGSIWFLHGTSDSGPGMKSWLQKILGREFNFNNHTISYPTAPSRPYHLFDGKIASVWYNRLTLSPNLPEDVRSIDRTATFLGHLLKHETELNGIPLSKVVIGGFSIGGSMALHLTYKNFPQVAGCFTLSSCLPPDSSVYDAMAVNALSASFQADSKLLHKKPQNDHQLIIGEGEKFQNSTKIHQPSSSVFDDDQPKKFEHETAVVEQQEVKVKLPKLFMSCGTADPLVQYCWSKETFSKLRDLGRLQGNFYTVPELSHTIDPVQLHLLHNWIEDLLSDATTIKNNQ